MPINQTVQTNPINLNKNVAIGIAIPFSTPSAFISTYDFKTQIKFNLINLLLTNKGERIFNIDFGTNIRKQLFEQMTSDTFTILENEIENTISIYIPEITVEKISVTPSYDKNIVVVGISYRINISNERDTITINFE